MAWITYLPKDRQALKLTPAATIGANGALQLNCVAQKLISYPFTFLTMYEPETKEIGLRECRPTDPGARTVKSGKCNLRGLLSVMGIEPPTKGDLLQYEVVKCAILDKEGNGQWPMLVLTPLGSKPSRIGAAPKQKAKAPAPAPTPAAKPTPPTVDARTIAVNIAPKDVNWRIEDLRNVIRNHALLNAKDVTNDLCDQWANRFDLPLVTVKEQAIAILKGSEHAARLKVRL